jgi:hypothetical protein
MGQQGHKKPLHPKTVAKTRFTYSRKEKNVLNNPLVNPEKVFLPPLHIKLGLMRNFVKAINKNGA